MFVTKVSYKKESAFRDKIKLHITNTVLVGVGKGNGGGNLEYQVTYDGYEMDYMAFSEIMNRGY